MDGRIEVVEKIAVFLKNLVFVFVLRKLVVDVVKGKRFGCRAGRLPDRCRRGTFPGMGWTVGPSAEFCRPVRFF
jgi:hypothetical protein